MPPGAPPESSSQRWRVTDVASVTWREWGDEFVVHVRSRAETHLLTAAAGGTLAALAAHDGPLTVDQLFDRCFRATRAVAMTAAESKSVLDIVQEFERLGVATRLDR